MALRLTDAQRWERFDAKAAPQPNGCLLWTGGRDKDGYGFYNWWVNGKRVLQRAHRLNYERHHGPIPDGLVLDHFACNTPACVHPDHVRPVATRENLLRGNTVNATNAGRTHCPRGHAYSGTNLHVTPAGKRWCRACDRMRNSEGRHKRTRHPHRIEVTL